MSGYILSYEAGPQEQPSGIPAQRIQQIFQRFQLINHAKNEDLSIQDQNNRQFENYDGFTDESLTQLLGNASLPLTALDRTSTENIESLNE